MRMNEFGIVYDVISNAFGRMRCGDYALNVSGPITGPVTTLTRPQSHITRTSLVQSAGPLHTVTHGVSRPISWSHTTLIWSTSPLKTVGQKVLPFSVRCFPLSASFSRHSPQSPHSPSWHFLQLPPSSDNTTGSTKIACATPNAITKIMHLKKDKKR